MNWTLSFPKTIPSVLRGKNPARKSGRTAVHCDAELYKKKPGKLEKKCTHFGQKTQVNSINKQVIHS